MHDILGNIGRNSEALREWNRFAYSVGTSGSLLITKWISTISPRTRLGHLLTSKSHRKMPQPLDLNHVSNTSSITIYMPLPLQNRERG